MSTPRRHGRDSPRLAGNVIVAAMLTLAACGFYVGSWGIIALVPVAMAIIGAGMAFQLAPRLVVLSAITCLALVKRCVSVLGVGRLGILSA